MASSSSSSRPNVQIMPGEQPEQDKEDVLRAMLFVAEDEIRAKEVQVELMQQMLVTTEQASHTRPIFCSTRACDWACVGAGDWLERRANW